MKRKDLIKKANLLLLALVLFFSPLAMSALYAANGIDVGKNDCSILFQIGMEYPDLNGIEIPLRLYRVAEVSESGVYTAKEEFENLDLSTIGAETTAEDWQKKAELGVTAVEENGLLPDVELTLNDVEQPQNKAENLSVGLYLVIADAVEDAWYEYAISPFLVSVPNNYYDAADETTSDAWVYEVEAELKPQRTDRYGDLEIVKTLSTYNKTLGPAFFVFQVDAVKDGKTVYSDVVSLNFTKPGEQTAAIAHIPAGADVTVKEVYSGASYQTVSAAEQKTVIVAEEEAGNPVSVSFENDYDKRLNSGSGIVNHFSYENESWDVEQRMEQTGGDGTSGTKGTSSEREQQDAKTPAREESTSDEASVLNEAGSSSLSDSTVQGSSSTVAANSGSGTGQEAGGAMQADGEENVAEDTLPQDEEDPLTEVEDAGVPLSNFIGSIFSDENSKLVTIVAIAFLAAVMAVTFSVVMIRKNAKRKAKERSRDIKQK